MNFRDGTIVSINHGEVRPEVESVLGSLGKILKMSLSENVALIPEMYDLVSWTFEQDEKQRGMVAHKSNHPARLSLTHQKQ